MDLSLRLEQFATRDLAELQAAAARFEQAVQGMEDAQQARFDHDVGNDMFGRKKKVEAEKPVKHYNLKALRRDWDALNDAVDAHLMRELETFVVTARRMAEGYMGMSSKMVDHILDADREHHELRAMVVKLRQHGLSIEPIRDAVKDLASEIDGHIRVHEVEIHPALMQGTLPGADRRETPGIYKHSEDVSRAIRASVQPPPPEPEPEEEQKGMLQRWFSMIDRMRGGR